MSTDDLETLIERHLDGLASSEEMIALSRRLEGDAAARQLYLRKARLHAALGATEASPTEEPKPPDAASSVTEPSLPATSSAACSAS